MKKEKIIFIVVLLMLLSPSFVKADEMIKKPVEGEYPTYLDSDSKKEIIDQAWVNQSDRIIMKPTDKFEANKNYRYTVRYKGEKKAITEEIESSYACMTSYIEYEDTHIRQYSFDTFHKKNDYGTELCTFPQEEYTYLDIDDIGVGIHPTYAKENSHYKVISDSWYNMTDQKIMTSEDVFEKGKKYQYTITYKTPYDVEDFFSMSGVMNTITDRGMNIVKIKNQKSCGIVNTDSIILYAGSLQELKIKEGAVIIQSSNIPIAKETLKPLEILTNDSIEKTEIKWFKVEEKEDILLDNNYEVEEGDILKLRVYIYKEQNYNVEENFQVINYNKNYNFASDETSIKDSYILYEVTYKIKENIKSITITSNKEKDFKVGDEVQLTATISPIDAIDKTITWSSNYKNIATVDQNGKVTIHSAGTVTIYATAANGIKSFYLMRIYEELESIEVSKKELQIEVGEYRQLMVYFHPTEVEDKTIYWTSSDPTVATVDKEGKITALKQGVTAITAKAINDMTSTCTVTVVNKDSPIEKEKYKVIFYDEDKETILKDTTVYEEGTFLNEIEKPQNLEKEGYVFTAWYSDNEFTNKVDFSGILTNDLTLYAKWEEERLSLETTLELLDFGETTINFKNHIQKKVIIKNTGNVDLKLNIKNPTDKGPFGSMGFDTGHLLKPGKEYELTLIANSSGTYHDTPGTYNGNYVITGTNSEKSTTLEIPAKIVLVKIPQKISYQTHVQTYGWKDYVSNGKMSGTEGEAKRLEGIKIKLENQEFEGNVLYRTHIQSFGWEKEFKKNDEMSGTSGLAKRLEAIEIKLDGEMEKHFDIYYRVHAQTFGWLGWARNGEPSGTAAYAKRLEGIEIKLVEKGEIVEDYGKKDAFLDANAPESITLDKTNIKVEAGDMIQLNATILPENATNKTIIWTSDNESVATVDEFGKVTTKKEGTATITATTSNNKKAECNINVLPAIPGVEYKTHVQTYGWQDYVRNGEMSGTSGEAKRLEGINIKLRNQPYEGSILYRTHIQSFGWEEEFKKNDEMSGTSGLAKRLEAIEIKLDGEMASHYDIYYRVHAQTFGWLNWARNGEPSGTAGYAKRLEGIEIVLVEKGEEPPIREDISTDESFIEKEEELTGLNKLANDTLMKLFLGGAKECSLIDLYVKDKMVMTEDIDNLNAYFVAQINEYPEKETITLEEMKNAVKKYFGKDYPFDVDSLNLDGTCSAHIYDKEKQAFVQREGGCGSACFRSTSYKIINTTEKDGLLNIQVKVIFADGSTEKYYSDYERTKEIGTFHSSLSSLYEKGSNYQFTFKLEDNNYVFVSSTPLN